MKRRVSQPGDISEREADQVADEVMRRPASEMTAFGSDTAVHAATSQSGTTEASYASSGQPLDAATRAYMEPRFGHDFGHVRVHTDEQAAQAAGDYHARAYTIGGDIVFGAEEYAPGTSEGQRLIAHELTHVVQQGSDTTAAATVQREPEGGTHAPVAAPEDIPSVPGTAGAENPDEWSVEELADGIIDKQNSILIYWGGALDIFNNDMKSEAELVVKPDYAGAIWKVVKEDLIGDLIKIPFEDTPVLGSFIGAGYKAILGVVEARDKAEEANEANKEAVKMKNFYDDHKGLITTMQASLGSNKQNVHHRAVASAHAGAKEKAILLNAFNHIRARFESTSVGSLYTKLSEEWIAHSESKTAVDTEVHSPALHDALVIIRVIETTALPYPFNKDFEQSMKSAENPFVRQVAYQTVRAYIQGAFGEKIAQGLRHQFRQGVDVLSLKVRKMVILVDNPDPDYRSDSMLDLTDTGVYVYLDENNQITGLPPTPVPEFKQRSEALGRYVQTRGLPSTTHLIGDK
jgi:hypothetical protein